MHGKDCGQGVCYHNNLAESWLLLSLEERMILEICRLYMQIVQLQGLMISGTLVGASCLLWLKHNKLGKGYAVYSLCNLVGFSNHHVERMNFDIRYMTLGMNGVKGDVAHFGCCTW